MNQYDDGRAEHQDDGREGNPDKNPLEDKFITSSKLNASKAQGDEMASVLTCARYIVNTLIGGSVDQLNEMRGLLDQPFFSHGSTVGERSIVLMGVADALWAMVEQDGTEAQLSLVFDMTKDLIESLEAEDPELEDAHAALGNIVVKLLSTKSDESGDTSFVESVEHRATLYQIAERLLRINSFYESNNGERLENIVCGDLIELNDDLIGIINLDDLSNSDIRLLENLVSCCQAAASSFFDKALSTTFNTLNELYNLFDDDQEESDEELQDDELPVLAGIAHAVCATLKALTVCQAGNKQESLWRELIEEFDSDHPFFGIALIGMSEIELSFVHPFVKKLLVESAEFELMPKTLVPPDEHDIEERFDDSSISPPFVALLDLLAANEELFPVLEEAMESLGKRQQRAIARVCRQAVDCDEIDIIDESVTSDGLFQKRIVDILMKVSPPKI